MLLFFYKKKNPYVALWLVSVNFHNYSKIEVLLLEVYINKNITRPKQATSY